MWIFAAATVLALGFVAGCWLISAAVLALVDAALKAPDIAADCVRKAAPEIKLLAVDCVRQVLPELRSLASKILNGVR